MTERPKPVERTIRLATSVDDLGAAWAFIMARIDDVGPDPQVRINPIWCIRGDGPDDSSTRFFEVVVEGMIPEEPK